MIFGFSTQRFFPTRRIIFALGALKSSQRRFKSIMPVDLTDKDVTLTYEGATTKILLHGANILTWTIDGKDQLWLSDGAILDGSKSVRGGVPLVFPVFGKATTGVCAALPQHGFARLSDWEFLGQTTASPLTVQFGLGPENVPDEFTDIWSFDFTLIYTVTLDKTSLTSALTITNPGPVAWDFQTLFHTYFKIPNVDVVSVTGLGGVTVKDKAAKSEYSAKEADVTIACEVDRVYENVSKPVDIVSSGTKIFEIERYGLDDVVVWNPWTACTKMADFKPVDAYKSMICVEAGSVSKWTTVQPGESTTVKETLKALL
ncbi:galactose mutarotase-like domain-containing protein [Lipomyces oligophaga]|uniref:galactose mutarotase-like domain-containing protein n=1 Tax=Lipomyces oligophaga TaxID=45792 RepID=UPI0034D003EC